ncbi:hypothetical protein ACWCOW_31005 [Streptomyces sp. NPDC001939]
MIARLLGYHDDTTAQLAEEPWLVSGVASMPGRLTIVSGSSNSEPMVTLPPPSR